MASILVVDDEPEIGEAIRRVLVHSGFEVVVAASADEAQRSAEGRQFDVIITDIIMPKTHGIELIKALKQRAAGTRIIAISGGGSFGQLAYKPEAISTQAYLAAARAAGAEEILTKPFDLSELLAAVRRLLPN